MSRSLNAVELLDVLLTEHRDRLTDAQLQAFEGMRAGVHGRFLTPNQSNWVFGVAERLGVQVAPSENLFSAMDPEKQARQRAAASRVKLPWEIDPKK